MYVFFTLGLYEQLLIRLDGRLESLFVRSCLLISTWLRLTSASTSNLNSHLEQVSYLRIFGPFSVSNK